MRFLNRVAIGESKLAWQYAAALLAHLLDDGALLAEFGGGWSEGEHHDKTARSERLLELLRAEL